MIATISIKVSVTVSLGFTVVLPRSPTQKIFGIPVYVSSVKLSTCLVFVIVPLLVTF